jgi:hypothetical protein
MYAILDPNAELCPNIVPSNRNPLYISKLAEIRQRGSQFKLPTAMFQSNKS